MGTEKVSVEADGPMNGARTKPEKRPWVDRWSPRGALGSPSESPKTTSAIQGDFLCRHHIEPSVQLCVPKEDIIPIPLKKIDVPRSTHTNLDVMQENRIDDYWNVDENRSSSDL